MELFKPTQIFQDYPIIPIIAIILCFEICIKFLVYYLFNYNNLLNNKVELLIFKIIKEF